MTDAELIQRLRQLSVLVNGPASHTIDTAIDRLKPKPISEVPDECTCILAHDDCWERMMWHVDGWVDVCRNAATPTHFLPIPDPPEVPQ